MKVIRFNEEKVYAREAVGVESAATGWNWENRYATICAAAVVLGCLVWGMVLMLFLAPVYVATGKWWPLLLGCLLGAGCTYVFVFWLGKKFFLEGLHHLTQSLTQALSQRLAVSQESMRKSGGCEGARLAEVVNNLMACIRASHGLAPLAAYREAFLAGSQPTYICDLKTGRFLDCNHAFADFIGMGREALLLQRLGDVTVGGGKSKLDDTGPIPSIAVENSPAVSLRFRHSSGKAREAVAFFRSVPDPEHPERLIQCAVVVPQLLSVNEEK